MNPSQTLVIGYSHCGCPTDSSDEAVNVASYQCCLLLDSVGSSLMVWLPVSYCGPLSVSGASYQCSVLSDKVAYCQTM